MQHKVLSFPFELVDAKVICRNFANARCGGRCATTLVGWRKTRLCDRCQRRQIGIECSVFHANEGLLLEDELIVIVIVKTQTTRFQFHEKFYREKFLPYKFRPHADLEEIARMAQQLDPNTDILSRFCICSCISPDIFTQYLSGTCICMQSLVVITKMAQHLYSNTALRSMLYEKKNEAILTEKSPIKMEYQNSLASMCPDCKKYS